MRPILGLIAGLTFGLGLILSGMADPAKVLNFLDIFGVWDPSLAFVMGGASITAFVGYRLVWRQKTPIVGTRFDLPKDDEIDTPLLTGAAIFGIGWGLGGFCPGPAWTALAMGSAGILMFLPAMLIGIVLGGAAKSLSIFKVKGA
tara:strand:+ start:351 stop:785 length:435 start_codon:yes stop_codon:yes gene_type:complete